MAQSSTVDTYLVAGLAMGAIGFGLLVSHILRTRALAPGWVVVVGLGAAAVEFGFAAFQWRADREPIWAVLPLLMAVVLVVNTAQRFNKRAPTR